MKSYRAIERDYLDEVTVVEDMEDMEDRVRRVVASLPRRERKLIILYAELGSIQRVAKWLKVPKSTVQYRLDKIKQNIKNQLNNSK